MRVRHGREGVAPGFAAPRMLDADHFSTESRHELRGERQRLLLLQRQDAHAVQRLAECLALRMSDVPYPHAASLSMLP